MLPNRLKKRDRSKAPLLILLIKRGISQADLARELGCSRNHVTSVLSGQKSSQRVIEHTARRLGQEPDDFLRRFIPRKKGGRNV